MHALCNQLKSTPDVSTIGRVFCGHIWYLVATDILVNESGPVSKNDCLIYLNTAWLGYRKEH